MDPFEEQGSHGQSGLNENNEHTLTNADKLQSFGDERNNPDNGQSTNKTIAANLIVVEKRDEPFCPHMDNKDTATDAESVTPICESLDSVTEVDAGKLYASAVNVEIIYQRDSGSDPIQSKLGFKTEHAQSHERDTEQLSHFVIDDYVDSVNPTHLAEEANRLEGIEQTFQNETNRIQTSIDKSVSNNEEVTRDEAIKVDLLKKELSNVLSEFSMVRNSHLKEIEDFNKEIIEFEERLKKDCNKLEDKEKILTDKMAKLHQDRDDLDKTISENENRWVSVSVMHADEREQMEAKLSEQKRLLDSLKGEINARNDLWREVQRAKEEVKDLNDKLSEANRLNRLLKSQHEEDIAMSEHILSSEIDDLENKKEALAKQRVRLQNEYDRLKNSDDKAQIRQLRNKIEYLNAEVQKRDNYISIQKDRLRKTREAANLLNDLNVHNYEMYREFYQNWQKEDRQLNDKSAEIKQSFRQGDGQSLVETLTWVQTTIERMPGNCIHANDFQRMSGIIQEAIRGDSSGIGTEIEFQEEPNCVLQ